jgi:hypothetical protein
LDVAKLATNATGQETIIENDASSDDGKNRSSTPHLVAKTKFGKKAAKI